MLTRFSFFALAALFVGVLAAAGSAPSQLSSRRSAAVNASPVASPVSPSTGRSVSVANAVTIHLTDGGFDPSYIEATNGHDLSITLVNSGQRPHAFRLDRFKVNLRLAPGQTATVVVHAPGFGDFPFFSDAPGDESMTGRLTFYI